MSSEQQFPAELIQRNQWCLWRIEPDKNGRATKVPYRPDGRKAASNDPRTWSAYAAVCDVLVRQPGSFGGVGYFFAADDPACGIDLDVSLQTDGNPQPWAAEIVARFQNTYRALSVSGVGLHVLCHARLPANGRNFNVPDSPNDLTGKRAQIGLFDRGRFFALTGQLYGQSPMELADHQQTIEWLLGLMQRSQLSKPTQPKVLKGELTDSDIIDRARKARNGAKFTRLWAGEWEPDYGSQSEADLALCCMLTFWCGPDAARIDALFRQSGLAREKWLGREDYRRSTINSAVEKTTEFYCPRRRSPSNTAVAQVGERRDSTPEIWVGARQLPVITAEALAALQSANEPPELFARSGRMVIVVRDERNRHVIGELSESGLRGRLARSGFYFKLNRDGNRIECSPPLDVVKDLLALPPADWGFPPLEALAEAPFLRPDGTICDQPGYDPRTCLFYAPAPGLQWPEIPEAPTRDHADAALELLDSAIGDFPFVDDGSRANALASILTPLVQRFRNQVEISLASD